MKMLHAAAVAAIVLLTACATTTGRPFDSAAASHFEDGKTTQTQVRQAIGEPDTVQDRGDGTTMWLYSFSEAKASLRDFVPFAGGDNHPTRQALNLVFDRAGVLESHTAMQTR